MKSIDTKSLLVGVFASILIFTLTSSKTQDSERTIEVIAWPAGTAIYNKQTMTIYSYGMEFGKLALKPTNIYKVAEDGSSLEKK